MHQRLITVAILLLAILQASLIETSRAQLVQITINQSSVSMTAHFLFQENLTTLPLFNVHLTLSNSSQILQPISDAIHKLVLSASVTKIDLRASTMNASGTWRLDEYYSIVVTGVSANSGSSVSSRIDFISMNASQSMRFSGEELNAIGSVYLLSAVNSQDPKTTVFYINGHQTLSAFIPAQTTSTFSLFDLTWVPPISSWVQNQDLLGGSTVWTLDEGSPRYNLTLGTKSPEGPLINLRMATFYPTFSVSVPATARIDGDTVSWDIPSPLETAMPVLVVISIAILIVVSFLDRRLTGNLRIRKKR